MKPMLTFAAVFIAAVSSLSALTIYPIDRATILAGSRFDFKVELDEGIISNDVKITINGADYKQILGKEALLITEDAGNGSKAPAFILRDTNIAKAGEYTVSVDDGKTKKIVTWSIFGPAKKPLAKNVIFLLADGLSVGHRTAARILSKGNTEGKSNGSLAMDKMDRIGFMSTSSVDSINVDSANSMSAYMTGQKSAINALGVYADRTKNPFDDPKQENIAELIRRTTNKSIGIVSDAELEDATPAAVLAHTRLRDEKAAIVQSFLDVKPEVILGGGSAYFIPKSVTGSKRKDETNYVDLFQKAGYALSTNATELRDVMAKKPSRVLGLFHPSNMDGRLDRTIWKNANTVPQFSDQPDLTDLAQSALDILSKNKEGFFLMVEAGLVDKFAHPMDWERSVYDTIMFDKVVEIAQNFAKTHPDTLIIVTGDHTHSISVYGAVDDTLPGKTQRDKVVTGAKAGFPNYVDADKDGYPDDPFPTHRLAIGWGNHPDYWETFSPKPNGTFNPTVKNEKGQYVADDQYKSDKATFIAGNLGYGESTEGHSVDDQILSASGPGSEKVKTYQESTEVFRILVETLGLNPIK